MANKNAVKALSRSNTLVAAQALTRLLVKAKGSTKVLIVRALLQVLQAAPVDSKAKNKLLNAALPHAGRKQEKEQLTEALRH